MRNFRNLDVWHDGHAFVLRIYEVTKSFPSRERFGLTSQLRRAAVSIPSNIAEGTGRDSDRDFGRFVDIALGSVAECDCELRLARDLEYLGEGDFIELAERADALRRKLFRLREHLVRTPR